MCQGHKNINIMNKNECTMTKIGSRLTISCFDYQSSAAADGAPFGRLELGVSSLSLLPRHQNQPSTTDMMPVDHHHQQQTTMHHHHQQQQQQPQTTMQHKRSRELPKSPSPSSVAMMTDDDETMSMTPSQSQQGFASPVAKRPRHDQHEHASSGNHHEYPSPAPMVTTGAVSPEEHHKTQSGVRSVTMECEGQYEWWKAPTAAPQLLTSTTMQSNDGNNNSAVVGCFVCQRFFVPAASAAAFSMQDLQQPTTISPSNSTLLDYFTSNKPDRQPSCIATSSSNLEQNLMASTTNQSKCTFANVTLVATA
jgi:hypothetical protein